MYVFMCRPVPKSMADDQQHIPVEIEHFAESAEGLIALKATVEEYIKDYSAAETIGPPDNNQFYSASGVFFPVNRCTWKHGAFIEVKTIKLNF